MDFPPKKLILESGLHRSTVIFILSYSQVKVKSLFSLNPQVVLLGFAQNRINITGCSSIVLFHAFIRGDSATRSNASLRHFEMKEDTKAKIRADVSTRIDCKRKGLTSYRQELDEK